MTTVEVDSGVTDHRWPLLVDNDRVLLYIRFKSALVLNEIWAMPASGGTPVFPTAGAFPVGVVENRLVFVNASGTVMSAPFDARRLRLTGPAISHITDAAMTIASSAAFVSLSQSGSLLYVVGAQRSRLMLTDLQGKDVPLLDAEDTYAYPRFSPDGKRVAVSIQSGSGWDVWIYDRSARTSTKLTTGGSGERAEWSPDGRRIAYRTLFQSIAWLPADHSGAEENILKLSRVNLQEGIISPKGDIVLARANGRGLDPGSRLGQNRRHDDPRLFTSRFAEYGPRFSPDQRWVAYSSDESGQQQVYVTPFPGPGPRYQVSNNGGMAPMWAPDGRRLFYTRGSTMMVATLTFSPFAVARNDSLFSGPYYFPFNHANYARVAERSRAPGAAREERRDEPGVRVQLGPRSARSRQTLDDYDIRSPESTRRVLQSRT